VGEAEIDRSARRLVIDGVYTEAEREYLRQYFLSPLVLVALVVDDEIRLARLRSRGREDDAPGVLEDLERRSKALNIAQLFDVADLSVDSTEHPAIVAAEISRFAEVHESRAAGTAAGTPRPRNLQ